MVAFSSGNHARGVAIAARRLGIRGDHRDAGRRAAGEDRGHARRGRRDHLLRPARPKAARRSRRESRPRTGATVVPSFDDPTSSPGRARSGSKSSISWPRRAEPDRGSVRRRRAWRPASRWPCPDAEIVAVEPEGWDDMARSLELGEIVPVAPDAPPTLCDAHPDLCACRRSRSASCATAAPGRWRSARRRSTDAVRFAWERAPARRRAGRRRWRSPRCSRARLAPREGTVVVLSGGNVDPALHARMVSRAA